MGTLCKMTTRPRCLRRFREEGGEGGRYGARARTWAKLPDLVGRRRAMQLSLKGGITCREAAAAPPRIVNPISERHYIVAPDVPTSPRREGRRKTACAASANINVN